MRMLRKPLEQQQTRILLIVAPNIVECHAALKAFRLDPLSSGIRSVSRVTGLRGWSRGTAFVTLNRETWGRDTRAIELDRALDAYVLSGHLRLAGERDLAECRVEARP